MLVSEFKIIALRYAKKSFFYDLIAWIPIDLFIISADNKNGREPR